MPLPGSPRFGGSFAGVVDRAAADARTLAAAGFDAILVENFGDAPFFPDRVPPITVAAMTACAAAARAAAPMLSLGINVLRNDAEAALAVAVATGAVMIRINVHAGARVTDQGIIVGRAHDTVRLRQSLGAEHVRLLCDVDVKHAAPLAPRPIGEEAEELALRGLADAVLVTGTGTGRRVARRHLEEVLGAVQVPVLVASGVAEDALHELGAAHGVVVGSSLRRSGLAGDPVDPDVAARFASAFRRHWHAH
jgi:hypothetical protein